MKCECGKEFDRTTIENRCPECVAKAAMELEKPIEKVEKPVEKLVKKPVVKTPAKKKS